MQEDRPEEAAPFEPVPAEEQAIQEADETEALRLELEAALAEKDKLLRIVAEQENQRRRQQREREEQAKYAAMPILRDLVRVADNLARALAAVPAGAGESDPALKALSDGVALTERELLAAFEKQGVKRIDPLGQMLDPHLHEAMFEVPSADQAPGTIVQVLEVGWMLHDRLIRPARVGVAKAP